MESRDFVYLQEAYQGIYQLDEEVEIATEYFYEMGLNEYGVNVLIEELGVEEFVDWVYDIAESYTLTEARARGSRIEPVTKSGKSIGSLKGGAKTAAINRLRREKEARREAEGRASTGRASDMEDALRSQAMKAAKREQPKAKKEVPSETKKEVPTQTKKGIAGAIDWAKRKAQTDIEHTRKGLKTLGQSWEKVSKTPEAKALRVGAKKGARFLERHGRTIGGAAGRAAAQNPAVVATFRAGQRLRGAMQKEDYDFEAWVEGLWEEGYDLSDYTWEGLYEAYIGAPLESYEAYNTIADYLLDEGYAHDLESADAIIASMSEGWIVDILEARVSYSAKKAAAGKDIGKPGKQFAKIARKAAKQYGSKERGEKVAGAILAKLRKG